MGGSLIITNYIASEESIQSQYSDANKDYNFGAQISTAVSAGLSGGNFQIDAQNVSNNTTKSLTDNLSTPPFFSAI